MEHRTRMVIASLVIIVMALVALQLFSALPAKAATISEMTVTCQYVHVRGKTEVNTPYVRVQVVLASDLTQVLAEQTVSTRPRAGAKYDARLSIGGAHLAIGTHVIITASEWDGTRRLMPSVILGADCGDKSATPIILIPSEEATSPYHTLTAISPTPTDIPPTFTPTPTPTRNPLMTSPTPTPL